MARRRKSKYEVDGGVKVSRVWSPSLAAQVKRGILTSFNPATYTANVLILEATNTFLQGVPLAYHMDGTSALVNNLCAVMFFDRQNYSDAVILAIYPGAGVGAPVYPPGRVTFVPTATLIAATVINVGVTNTYTITGSYNVPVGALAVVMKVYFTSATTGTWVDVNKSGVGNSGFTVGGLYTAGGIINGSGIVQLSANGRIGITANNGNCTVTAYILGYII